MSTLTWLDHTTKTFVQAVLDWDAHRDTKALSAWLAGTDGTMGDIACLTLPLVESFVQGVNACPFTARASSNLPRQWPRDSLEQTLPLRKALLGISAWRATIEDELYEYGLGTLNLLYPDEKVEAMLNSGMYSPQVESQRLWLGMAPNEAWWQRFPVRVPTERPTTANDVWTSLVKELVSRPHPMQGLRIALLHGPLVEAERAMAKAKEHSNPSSFRPPTIAEILASHVHGKEALALWTAKCSGRDEVPNPAWWVSWDAWVAKEPHYAELALVALLLNHTNTNSVQANGEDRDGILRHTLTRLASLREPPPSYSIVNLMAENKKFKDWTADQLLGRTLTGPQRGLHLFDGLTTHYDQLLLHYHKLLQPAYSIMEFDPKEVGLLLDGA